MSPLLPPEPDPGRHRCEPPVEPHRVQIPRGPGVGAHVTREYLEKIHSEPPRYTVVGNHPPTPGTTWDCPICALVWIVVDLPGRRQFQHSRGYSAGRPRTWMRASRWQARRHFRRIAQARRATS